jgi:hypothetical protein
MSVNAQQRQGRQGFSAKDRLEQLEKQVTLNDAEKAKVLELFEKQDKRNQEQFAKMRENPNADRDAMRTQMQEQRKADNAELEAIIGKEKMETYQKFLETQRANRGQGQGNRPRPQ